VGLFNTTGKREVDLNSGQKTFSKYEKLLNGSGAKMLTTATIF
jgi:hypothetical protein